MKNKRSTLFILVLMLALTGCSSSLTLKAQKDKSCDIDFSLSLGESLMTLVRSLTMTMGGDETSPLFSADQIRETLTQSGITPKNITSPKDGELFAEGNVPEEKLKATENFFFCTENSLGIRLNPENLQNFAQTLPAESANFLELLMAPVFTGEEMDKEEYREILASIYGEEIVSELDSSFLKIKLLPPPGKKIKAGKGEYSLPLADFLTLKNEVLIKIDF